MRRRLGDRRTRPRFEIVGDLVGTLETVLRLPIRNVSATGLLLESHLPLTVGSVHRIGWDVAGREVSAQVRVRQVRPVIEADGERTHLIGVEFMAPNPVLAEQLQRWIVNSASAQFPGV